MNIRPSEIRFTHDNIKAQFRDGRNVIDTFTQILNDKIDVEDIPKLHVVYTYGNYYAVQGNRRLCVYRELEAIGKIKEIRVLTRGLIPHIFDQKHTTTNEGKSVTCRNDRNLQQKMKQLGNNWKRNQANNRRSIKTASVHQNNYLNKSTPIPKYPQQTSYVERSQIPSRGNENLTIPKYPQQTSYVQRSQIPSRANENLTIPKYQQQTSYVERSQRPTRANEILEAKADDIRIEIPHDESVDFVKTEMQKNKKSCCENCCTIL